MDLLQIPFVGAYELRKNLPLLLAQLQKKGEGLVVTQQGKPAGVFLSVKKYLEMKMVNEELEEAIKELADKKYIGELMLGAEEIRRGKGTNAAKVFKNLKI